MSELRAARWRSRISGLLVLLAAACAGDSERGRDSGLASARGAATSTAAATAPATASPPATASAAATTSAQAGPPSVPSAWRFKPDAPVVSSTRGMVASDAALATQAGVEILKKGGNAVDAAVATAFALAVVYPQAGNIGGGGFMVVREPDGKTSALDFREIAPRAATRDMYVGKEGKPSIIGYLAAGVPGSVAGLYDAHKKFGTLKWADVVAPAIKLAAEGFKVDDELADSLSRAAENLRKFPASAELFLTAGEAPKEGSIHKNPDLAKTLRRISDRGPKGFYEGETQALILAEMKRGGGLISREDLLGYKARFRDPIETNYRGHKVLSMPPPSSGGLVLSLLLRILEPYDLQKMGYGSADALHVEAEAMRRAFAYRNHFLGDPDFVKVPTHLFVSPESAARLRGSIKMEKATPSTEIEPGALEEGEKKHTTHFSVVDEKGMAVGLTTTLNTSYGSCVTVKGAGFLLNNEMDDFATILGKPNVFGLIQGEANAIAPGKRMLSSMTPTIVVGPDGKVVLVAGAAGGPTIITAVFHVLTNVVDYKLPTAFAQGGPRIHHQHLPDQIFYEENGLREDVLAALTARGHKLATRKRIGDAPSIMRQGDTWTSIGEPRNTSSLALGY